MTANAAVQFFALPNSPHLTRTHCGYTLMTLAGFSGFITSDQIEMVTINGVEQKFKPLSDNTIAVIPAFRQEAQMVKVYCKSTAGEGSVLIKVMNDQHRSSLFRLNELIFEIRNTQEKS